MHHLEELKFTNVKKKGLDLLIDAISNLKALKYLKLKECLDSGLYLKHEQMERIASMFKNLTNLTKLNLHFPIDNELIKNITSFCSKLEYLSIMEETKFDDNNNYSELKSISNLQHLTTLKLKWMQTASSDTLMSVFTNLENLQRLELFGLKNVNHKVFEAIVLECPKLKEMKLEHVLQTELDHNLFGLGTISCLKNLSRLDLSYLGDSSKPEHLLSLFQDKSLENLLELNLIQCNFNMDLVKAISISCPNLEELSLHQSCDEVLKLKDFPKFQNLNNLDFSTNEMTWRLDAKRKNIINTTEEYISIFANKKLENLKSLTCPSFQKEINDEVMLAIAVGCPKLEYLEIYIGTTSVTARGIIFLIRHCANLKALELNFEPEEKSIIMTKQCEAAIKKYSPRLCIT